MILDVSTNGNLADEAQMLLAVSTLVGLFLGGAKLSRRIRNIDHAVNNVDVPISDDAAATLGQRIVRLEAVNTDQAKTLFMVSDALNEHVRSSNRRHERIEKKLDHVLEKMDDVRKIAD